MNLRVLGFTGCIWLALTGCVALPTQTHTLPPFDDALFQPPSTPVDTHGVLALSPAMKN